MWYLCCVSWLILPLMCYFIYRFYFPKKNEKLEIHKKNWKEDTVYLYQFPRDSNIPSLCPFCLKIETFLRLNKIQYENQYVTWTRSKYGLIPFIELNGEHIADSQIIEEKLKQHFKIKPLADSRDEAVARSVARLVENHTFFLMVKYKIYDDPSQLVSIIMRNIKVPLFARPMLLPITSFMMKCKISKRIWSALSMYSEEEFLMLLRKDFETIAEILGLNDFLFGDEICAADCTVFAHLASVYYLPYSTIVANMIRDDYTTLVEYQERIKKQLFETDFEQI